MSEILKWTIGLPYALWCFVYAEWVLWKMNQIHKKAHVELFPIERALITAYKKHFNPDLYWN